MKRRRGERGRNYGERFFVRFFGFITETFEVWDGRDSDGEEREEERKQGVKNSKTTELELPP